MALHIVPKAPPPDTPLEKARRRLRSVPPVALSCPRCTGIALKPERIGMFLKNGKPTGGTLVYICSECDRRGERVVVA